MQNRITELNNLVGILILGLLRVKEVNTSVLKISFKNLWDLGMSEKA